MDSLSSLRSYKYGREIRACVYDKKSFKSCAVSSLSPRLHLSTYLECFCQLVNECLAFGVGHHVRVLDLGEWRKGGREEGRVGGEWRRW